MIRTPRFHCRGAGPVPGQGTKILESHMPHDTFTPPKNHMDKRICNNVQECLHLKSSDINIHTIIITVFLKTTVKTKQ